jgi:nitroreductase
MDCFSDLLKTRRSIRRFKDKEVSLETIMDLLQDSTLAPSASNDQPWKFIIVRDMKLMKRISDESKKNLLGLIEANPDTPLKRYEGMLRNESMNVFYNAPCMVFVVGSKTHKTAAVDCALAASYFMMSASSRGLGTCWVNLGAYIQDPAILEELGMPDDCQIVAPLILGYPEEIPPASERKSPEVLKVID